MPTVDAAAVLDALSWRYATKQFDPARKIPETQWASLERAAQLAPSSYGLAPWRFVVVRDPALRTKLRAHAWNQPQITDASHLVVFCRKLQVTPADVDAYVDRIVEVRNAPRPSLDGYRGMMLGSIADASKLPGGSFDAWTSRQVYIALGFFLAAAAMIGVDTCPMEGFDPSAFDELLGLRQAGYASTVVATAGYRSPEDGMARMKKVRPSEHEVLVRV
jgi:nitroreductase